MRKFHGITLIVLLICCFVSGNTRYISIDASGKNDGSSWRDAYVSFRSAGLNNSKNSEIRGDTFYIAGNAAKYYNSVKLSNMSTDETTAIYLIKATEKNHGTDSGWKKEYGIQPCVMLAPLYIKSSSWSIDGVTGGGPDNWDTEYGIKIIDTTSNPMTSIIRFSKECGNIHFKHVECSFEKNKNGSQSRDQDVVYAIRKVSNTSFVKCSFKYPGRCHFMTYRAGGLTIDHCYFLNNGMSDLQHTESWSDQGSDNVVIKNCLFEGCQGTGIIVVLSRGGKADTSDTWKIYGNIFKNGSRGYVTDGSIAVINKQVAKNWTIANNTFLNINPRFKNTGISFGQSSTASENVAIVSNLWINCGAARYSGGERLRDVGWNTYYNTEYDNKEKNSSNHRVLYVDSLQLEKNTRFLASLPKGKMIPEITGPDIFGNSRGENDEWTVGAVQYKK